MIERRRELDFLQSLIRRHPVVGILGARQVGKTTLARQLSSCHAGAVAYFDLENPEDVARLAEPMLSLKGLEGLVVFDEVQRRPDLFPVLRVLADRPTLPARFLVLGSASPELLRQSSESLAGRIFYHELDGFSLDEVGAEAQDRLWLRGGFPRSFLAESDAASAEWRRGFVRTFLERDLPELGVRTPAETMRRFWSMLAHYHAQVWNGAELARAFGVSAPSVRRYLDTLTSALVLRQLQPWFENLSKRQVRAPKIYIADSGLLHALLNLETSFELLGHPKLGASWEGFALGEIVRRLGARWEECFFWATHSGAELDLLVMRGLRRYGFEFKNTATPKLTPSMRTALEDLKLERIDVIHAGEHTFPLAERVRAVALRRIEEDLEPLGGDRNQPASQTP
ncbi:MAG: ATP-binding protein [Thermoanaerobaculia bacterium]|nr:ATP-binding protein [Thermoanaerobaculia bacterium]